MFLHIDLKKGSKTTKTPYMLRFGECDSDIFMVLKVESANWVQIVTESVSFASH